MLRYFHWIHLCGANASATDSVLGAWGFSAGFTSPGVSATPVSADIKNTRPQPGATSQLISPVARNLRRHVAIVPVETWRASARSTSANGVPPATHTGVSPLHSAGMRQANAARSHRAEPICFRICFVLLEVAGVMQPTHGLTQIQGKD